MSHSPPRPVPARPVHPLRGRRIVVTRAREQAGELVRALEEMGAEVGPAPTIRIEPLPDLEPLRRALSRLADYRWTVFTSQNTVHVVLERVAGWGLAPHIFAQTRVAAIGPATADALGAAGVRVELVPAGYVAESLVEALATQDSLGGARILIPRAATARDALPAGLRALGAQVDVIPVYETVREAGDGRALAAELLAGRLDAVTFTSSSTVRHFVELVGREAAGCGRCGTVTIGPVTAATARELGLTVAVEANEYTVPGLVAALVRYYGETGKVKGGKVSRAVKLGTRGSALALWQAEWVRAALARHRIAAELVVIATRGDAEVDRPLHQLEGKGFFTREIEEALLDGRIDIAVHSLKDLPTELPDGLALGVVPERGDAAEALVTRADGIRSVAGLAAGARVGTSSLRRGAQLRHLRPDLEVVPLRGHVPTRVQKVKEGRDGLDAALLAAAGLERLELADRIAVRLDPLEVMPAPGQGALGLEVRADDRAVRALLAPLEHAPSARAVAAERSLLRALGGGCQAPVAAYVGVRGPGPGARLYGRVTAQDGSIQITASADIDDADPAAAGVAVAGLLQAQGASSLLGR